MRRKLRRLRLRTQKDVSHIADKFLRWKTFCDLKNILNSLIIKREGMHVTSG